MKTKTTRKRARKPNTDHVVTDFSATPQQFVCRHCGETSKIILPMPLDEFVKRGEAFVALHQFCRPRDDAPRAHSPDAVTALAEKLYGMRMTRAAQTGEPEPEYIDCIVDAQIELGTESI